MFIIFRSLTLKNGEIMVFSPNHLFDVNDISTSIITNQLTNQNVDTKNRNSEERSQFRYIKLNKREEIKDPKTKQLLLEVANNRTIVYILTFLQNLAKNGLY